MFAQILLKLGGKFFEEGCIDHLLHPINLRSILREGNEDGVLVRPLEVSEGRVGRRGRIDDRLALGRIVHDFVDIQLPPSKRLSYPDRTISSKNKIKIKIC